MKPSPNFLNQQSAFLSQNTYKFLINTAIFVFINPLFPYLLIQEPLKKIKNGIRLFSSLPKMPPQGAPSSFKYLEYTYTP